MRIIIDGRMLGWTGVGVYTLHLLDELQAIDTKNEYLVLVQSVDWDKWEPKAANFSKIKADFAPYSLSEQLGLAKLLKQLKPDLVHFVSPNIPILYRGKHVTTIHDLTLVDYKNVRGNHLLYEIKYWAFRWVIRAAARRSDAIIADTNFGKADLQKRYQPRQTEVIYPAVDIENVKPEPYPIEKPYLLYVGNAYPYKNLGRLIKAFVLLDRPELKLVLVGKKDYFYEQLEERIKTQEPRSKNRIVFTDYLPMTQVAWLYQNAELYVFPSLSEGFGLPGLGAMSFGTPVAAADASCLPEVYGDAAIYFDPKSSPDMAQKIDALLNSPDELARLRKIGPGHARQFSWRKMATETLSVYESVN